MADLIVVSGGATIVKYSKGRIPMDMGQGF